MNWPRIGILLAKWLVIPSCLAVGGYFFVGPHLGDIFGSKAEAPKSVAAPQPEDPVDDTPAAPTYKEPDVEISAVPKSGTKKSSKRKHKESGSVTVDSSASSGVPLSSGSPT